MVTRDAGGASDDILVDFLIKLATDSSPGLRERFSSDPTGTLEKEFPNMPAASRQAVIDRQQALVRQRLALSNQNS